MLRNAYQYYDNKNFYLCICLFICWFVYTGTFWNMNRNPPFVYHSGSSIAVIYPGQRMQTVAEGLLIATLMLGLSGLVSVLNHYVPAMEKEMIKEGKYMFYVSAFAFLILFFLLQFAFVRKTPSYLSHN